MGPTVSAGGGELVVGVVYQRGLFPASDLSTPVLLSMVGSITGLGIHPLSWPELAALWDIPILVLDCLSEALGKNLLREFCLLAPAKVLFVDANTLLTTLFPGGTTCSSEDGDMPGLTPRPAPKTDVEIGLVGSKTNVEIGLAGLGFVTAHNTHAHMYVIKGDTQEADSAAVLDYLWVHAFLYRYRREHHGPRHLHALGLSAAALVGGLGNPSRPDGWEATASGLSTLALFRLFALRHQKLSNS